MAARSIRSAKPKSTVSFPPWPKYEDDEIEAAAAVLRSGQTNYWTGDTVRQFETEFAQYVRCKHAVAVANGTVALELALYALGVRGEDEVIVPSRTFVATASAVAMQGATPVVADIDLDSQNLTVDTIRPRLTPRTKGIIVVHLAGWPCDMTSIMCFAREHELFVIEDCAQAHGATVHGRSVGSFADISAFSFCQDKIMTTAGEGGMVVTNDSQLWERAWSHKDHGKNYQAAIVPPTPGYRLIHEEFGTNWRLTAVQASIGLCQLGKLDRWVNTRRHHAAALDAAFAELPGLRLPRVPQHSRHSYYKYYTFVQPQRLGRGWDRDRIMTAINAAGVPCAPGASPEIYREAAFTNTGLGPTQRHPNAMNLGETSLMFMVHPTLGDAEIQLTCDVVTSVLTEAST